MLVSRIFLIPNRKMKNVVLFIALIITQFAFSQGFVTENKTWHVRDNSWWDISTEIFKTEGDTIINALTYKKLWSSFNDSAMINAGLRGFLREESGIVYFRDSYFNENKVLYNFNLEAGDTATIYNAFCGDWMVFIMDVDTVEYYGVQRKRWTLEGWSGEYWIEGIGSTNGLLYSMLYECTADIYKELICCHENDSLIFMKQYEDECYQTNVGIGEVADESHVIINPNPVIQGQTFVIQCNKEIVKVDVYNCAGVLVKQLFSDHLKTLSISSGQLMPGFYLIRIRTTEGLVFTKKLVIARG
jgi:hypothetical protein